MIGPTQRHRQRVREEFGVEIALLAEQTRRMHAGRVFELRVSGRDGLAGEARRWHLERDIRNIKTTLSMEVLRCQTAQMVEKDLWVYLLACNVIRPLREDPTQRDAFFRLIASLAVGHGPERLEPRAGKRRPKPCPWRKVPRAEARWRIRWYGCLPDPST
ncbi:MAG: hypothetical protein IPF50_03245 [Proteobacteria bacterium]|nr:hypothetical protein [Pseudomonadota bacterium]